MWFNVSLSNIKKTLCHRDDILVTNLQESHQLALPWKEHCHCLFSWRQEWFICCHFQLKAGQLNRHYGFAFVSWLAASSLLVAKTETGSTTHTCMTLFFEWASTGPTHMFYKKIKIKSHFNILKIYFIILPHYFTTFHLLDILSFNSIH